jgi:hypothetical protein
VRRSDLVGRDRVARSFGRSTDAGSGDRGGFRRPARPPGFSGPGTIRPPELSRAGDVGSSADRPSRATPGVFGSGDDSAARIEPSRRRRFICEPSVPRDPWGFRVREKIGRPDRTGSEASAPSAPARPPPGSSASGGVGGISVRVRVGWGVAKTLWSEGGGGG